MKEGTRGREKEREREGRERERGVRAERTGRGRMEIAQACNRSRYRSMISPKRALRYTYVRERKSKEAEKGGECGL